MLNVIDYNPYGTGCYNKQCFCTGNCKPNPTMERISERVGKYFYDEWMKEEKKTSEKKTRVNQ